MKRIYALLNILAGAALLIGMYCYMEFGGLPVKGTASFCFVLLGAINLICAVRSGIKRMNFPIAMFAGLVFAMLGDILLGFNFILGAGLFAVGHVLYTVAFVCVRKFRRLDLILSSVIFLASALLITTGPMFDFGGMLMEAVCLVYALVISMMVGKAVSNCLEDKCCFKVLLALGSILFYFSDLMLVLYYFGNAPWIVDRLCLLSYFPAQGLLAGSVYFYIRRELQKNGSHCN